MLMIILLSGDLGGINIWAGDIVVVTIILKCQCVMERKDISWLCRDRSKQRRRNLRCRCNRRLNFNRLRRKKKSKKTKRMTNE